MKQNFTPEFYLRLCVISFCFLIIFNQSSLAQSPVASVNSDSTCVGGPVTLTVNITSATIQWQSNIGAGWVNETGPGATSPTYIAMPIQTTDYRALVTTISGTDTSNVVNVFVLILSPATNTTTDSVRCGIGIIDLTASAPGSAVWYASDTNNTVLAVGNNFSTFINSDTTFWVANADSGAGTIIEDSLFTTVAGGNGQNGNMFDLVALNTITIESFDIHIGATSTETVEIYWKNGTYAGFEATSSAWTLIGSTSVTGNGIGNLTPVPLPINVQITAGNTVAFYVTLTTSTNIDYTNGTAVGNVFASDANLEFKEGIGNAYPFGGTFSPRIWNGQILYSVGGGFCTSAKIPVNAYTSPPPAITATTSPLAICQTDTVTIDITSSNPNYNYSWSPATFLDTTTGPNVISVPTTTITYILIAEDTLSQCATSDTFLVDVGVIPSAGLAIAPNDTVCVGATTAISATNTIGNLQWQINDGTGWTNITAPGADSSTYSFMPAADADYRLVATSGGCPNDTSNSVSIAVINITDPTPFDTLRCGPGPVNMHASGTGTMVWYDSPVGGTLLGTGNPFTIDVTGTDTFYVESNIGTFCTVGETDNTIGSTSTFVSTTANWGLQFNTSKPIYLDRVHVYGGSSSGFLTVNLRDDVGGNILNTGSFPIQANVALQPLDLGWFVPQGSGFALEVQAGSVAISYNFTGSGYPINTPGCPVTITNYFNPNPNFFDDYLYFYDWQISDGCKSSRFPAIAEVFALPPKPSIVKNINDLSTPANATAYQWYLNGIPIPGATQQTFTVTLLGDYQVEVTGTNGCKEISNILTVTVVSPVGIDEGSEAIDLQVYPNPVNDVLNVAFELVESATVQLSLSNALGQEVLTYDLSIIRGKHQQQINLRDFENGIYTLSIKVDELLYNRKVILAR